MLSRDKFAGECPVYIQSHWKQKKGHSKSRDPFDLWRPRNDSNVRPLTASFPHSDISMISYVPSMFIRLTDVISVDARIRRREPSLETECGFNQLRCRRMPKMGKEEMAAPFKEWLESGVLVTFAEPFGDGFLLRFG